MSLNGKMHRRNLLQIVIGGSGAGKTRFFVKPNLMEANCSFLVTDPKGETLRAVAPLLLQKGYVIKVFDLIDKSPLQRGTGAILCMADQLGAFDQNNLIVPISLI